MLNYFKNYPKHVFCILTNEFCERFSYYGMRAILVIYLWKEVGLEQKTATAIYHAFIVISYFMPIVGAIIADGWIGKCKTIISISIIYALGNIVMTISAIPFDGTCYIYGPIVGLILIAFGTGGIKPCVSSFGADQFSEDQKLQKESFFSFFYMAINIGSLLSTIITPTIRGDIFCFNDSCYALAFGIPAALMVFSIFVFLIGLKWYTNVPPGQSVITRLGGCVFKGMTRRISCRKRKMEETKEHWLDYAEPDYDRQFISDVKDVIHVMWIFLPLPIFWALYDQQGSRWTLQATQMNGDLGSFVLQPDILQAINPLLIIVFLPLMESIVFPCFAKCGYPLKPLKRMSYGMLLTAGSFIIAAGIQVLIDRDMPAPIASGEARIRFINTSPCTTFISKENNTLAPGGVASFNSSEYFTMKAGNLSFDVEWTGCAGSVSTQKKFRLSFLGGKAYHVYLGNDIDAHLFEQTQLTQTNDIESIVRFYNSLNVPLDMVTMKTTKDQENEAHEIGRIDSYSVSKYEHIILASFYVRVSFNTTSKSLQLPTEVQSKNGAVYTIIIRNRTSEFPVSSSDAPNPDDLQLDMIQLTDIKPWSVNILLQIPQYVVITVGECLFSVTGLAFAYTQAPASMKSFLSAMWLMTIAVGNLIVIIVAESGSSLKQVYEFLLFVGLLFFTTFIFAIMTLFYKYVDREEAQPTEGEATDGSTNNEKKLEIDSKAHQQITKESEAEATTQNNFDSSDYDVTRL